MNLEIRNEAGEKLDVSFSPAVQPQDQACLVILGHGLTGNKDRPLLVDLAGVINELGFDTLRISYAGNGESEGDFRASNITKETEDLRVVVEQARQSYADVSYVGHSMGGAVGVNFTATYGGLNRLVSLAGMVNSKKFAETEFGGQERDASVMWDEPEFPLSSTFYRDLTEVVVSLLPKAEKIDIPWLLVHGTADDVVLADDTRAIASLGKANASAHFVEGGDHSFSEEPHRQEVLAIAKAWFAGN